MPDPTLAGQRLSGCNDAALWIVWSVERTTGAAEVDLCAVKAIHAHGTKTKSQSPALESLPCPVSRRCAGDAGRPASTPGAVAVVRPPVLRVGSGRRGWGFVEVVQELADAACDRFVAFDFACPS